jgi:hypothetical protein
MAPRGAFRATNSDRSKFVELPRSADDLPDTVSVDLDDKDPQKFTIVEIDDTPEADRERPTELEGGSLADQEEDLRDVSVKTKKRIERLRFETHTERRAREKAERERDEAVNFAKSMNEENARLRTAADSGNTALANSMIGERQARIDDATRRLTQAHSEGNSQEISKATQDLSLANAEMVAIRTRPAAPTPEPQRQQPAQQQPASNIAPRAAQWVERNRGWFNVNGADQKSAKALSLHYDLVNRGVDPNSETYIRELDKGLKAVYPEHESFDSPSENDGGRQGGSTPRRTNVVADGDRGSGSTTPANPRTVELTRSELSIAKRLGVTPQAYAKEKMRIAQTNGGAQ